MKKFFAGLFAFINLVLFPLVLLGTITIYWVFTPNTVKKVIHASEIGENLPSLIVAVSADKGDSSEGLDVAAAADLVGQSFSSADVYAITDSLVDSLGAWFTTNQPLEKLDFTINISSLKVKLIPAISAQINTAAVEGVDTAAITNEVTKNIPDTVNVQDLLQQQLLQNGGAAQLTLINQQIELARTYWSWLHWIVWIGWIVIGLNSLWMILLRLRPGYAPFGWLAVTSLLTLFELIPVTFIVWLAPQFILPLVSGSFDNAIITVINKALSALMSTYLWPLIFVLIGMLVSTIFWFIIRGIVKHHITHKERSTPTVAPTQPAAPAANAQQPKTEKQEL